jgi:large repetitive protein
VARLDVASAGSQYLDIAGTGAAQQTFTVTQAGVYNFGGSFANRDTFDPVSYGGTGHTATIEILNASGVVVATISQPALTYNLGDEAWFAVSGSANLGPGTYTYKMTMGDFVHFDNAYVNSNTNVTRTFTEGGAPIPIANPLGSAVSDPDTTTIASATVVLTNAQAADSLSIGSLAGLGITSTINTSVAGQITVTLTGSSSLANYQTAINAIMFQNTSDTPSILDRVINVTVNDGALTSNTAVSTIKVVAVNDAPVTGVPTAQTVFEDTVLTFSAANSNAITITDIDAGTTGLETVTLSVGHGTLTLATTAGVSIVSGANGSGAVTIRGTLAQVNAAIAGLAYQATANYNGSDVLTVDVVDDGLDTGHTTSNGAMSAVSQTVAITVTPVNDAPVSTVPGAQTVNEDTALVFSGTRAISIADVDAGGSGLETVTLSVAHGTLNLGSFPVGLTYTNDGTGMVTLTGTLSQVNAAIAGLRYQGVANYNGPDLLTIQVKDDGTDNGVAASNGALSGVVKTVAITVTSVNDAPAGTDRAVGIQEDAPYTFTTADFGFTDPNDSPANTLQSVIITTLPPAGDGILSYVNAGGTRVPVTSGQELLAAQISSLVFTPALDRNGTGLGSFTFQVRDNGGTANGGADLDPTPNTFNFNIAAVNDAPVAVGDSYATTEAATITIAAGSGLR